MTDEAQISAPEADEPDPELVKAMASRVVRRKGAPYGTRKAGPGRPKGSPKTPGSGRRSGTPNVNSPEFRDWLNKKARPLEKLAAICNGDEIDDGGKKRKPTLAEQMRAAETISRKVLPDLSATTLSGPNGGPIPLNREPSRLDLAKVLINMLSEASERGAPRDVSPPPPNVIDAEPVPVEVSKPAPAPPEEPAGPAVGHVEPMDWIPGVIARLDERLPDGRERWTARDERGRVIKTAFGLAALKANLRWEAT